MSLIKTIHNADVGLPEVSQFTLIKERKAARAVLLMGETVALMYASADNYYKLPGGGIELGEDSKLALKREIMEETGCEADIGEIVGEIIEERGEEGFRQYSICYIARQKGIVGQPQFTQKELDAGFQVHWAETIDEAIRLVDDVSPENGGGKFMKERDATFLRSAKLLLEPAG